MECIDFQLVSGLISSPIIFKHFSYHQVKNSEIIHQYSFHLFKIIFHLGLHYSNILDCFVNIFNNKKISSSIYNIEMLNQCSVMDFNIFSLLSRWALAEGNDNMYIVHIVQNFLIHMQLRLPSVRARWLNP